MYATIMCRVITEKVSWYIECEREPWLNVQRGTSVSLLSAGFVLRSSFMSKRACHRSRGVGEVSYYRSSQGNQ